MVVGGSPLLSTCCATRPLRTARPWVGWSARTVSLDATNVRLVQVATRDGGLTIRRGWKKGKGTLVARAGAANQEPAIRSPCSVTDWRSNGPIYPFLNVKPRL
jgi:hypothetical protein